MPAHHVAELLISMNGQTGSSNAVLWLVELTFAIVNEPGDSW